MPNAIWVAAILCVAVIIFAGLWAENARKTRAARQRKIAEESERFWARYDASAHDPPSAQPLPAAPNLDAPAIHQSVPKARKRAARNPEWDYLPEDREVLVIDCETTGLSAADRIVSFGAIILSPGELKPTGWAHLVFNPGRPSHPMAARVHGLSDAFLGRQPAFADHAAEIKGMLRGRAVAAHNLAFDMRFLDRELRAAGLAGHGGKAGRYCTMEEWRRRFPGRSAKLSAIAQVLDLPAQSEVHGALSDAVLASLVLQHLQGYEDLHFFNPALLGFQNARANQ